MAKPEYTDEDMANVGRALMERLPDGYNYMNCPSEIVTDLSNERDDLKTEIGQLSEALKNIADQMTLSELSENGEDCEGDFEGAYDTIIGIARRALELSSAQTA